MAEFIGIRNENEFYFAHYLASLMDDELKEQCQNEELAATRDKILKLGNDYYEVRRLREKIDERKGLVGTEIAYYKDALRAFIEKFANVLGYADAYKPMYVAFPGETVNLPVSGAVMNADGTTQVVLVESCRELATGRPRGEVSMLRNFPTSAQLKCDGLTAADRDCLSERFQGSKTKSQMPYWENLLTNQLFSAQNHPRFVIVFGENAILLADYTKWAERRSLVFQLDDIFEQGDRATCRAMACLLSKSSLAPTGGSVPLPDKLDEHSHKNAFGVSKSLRYAMREAIEDLGNAIIANKPADVEIDAATLSKECITVMYRFLFVLFLESRKDLKYFKRTEGNVANDIFWSAYGLDHLRDLETVPLLTEADKNGHYFDASIKQLFSKIWNGANVEDAVENPEAAVDGFRLMPLKAHLFDPDRTPLFDRSKIPNSVWQKIIFSLSIGETGTGKRRRKGRISYAQLGIQQLGAVYEALLSYTGFYAKEDLYEVRDAGVKNGDEAASADEEDEEPADTDEKETKGSKQGDVFETGYFITEADLPKYTEAEIVADKNGRRVCHKKGTFIYRMAGRDRERSASYYTPHELTRCLVRQAIAHRITPEMKAKDIMKLTVCEPAMGSAAFLNEMIDQLAEIYLARAEKERGETIPLEQRAAKKARVKMVIADQNVFGVDLNPMAADLAEVSLWLGTIGGETEPTGQNRDSVYIPWFGNQLVCGNSIIGARREVERMSGVREKVPFAGAKTERTKGGVWHFLLPDEGMALTLDKVVKGLCPEEDKKIKAWKKSFRLADEKKEKEKFLSQREKLMRICKGVDALWDEAAEEAKRVDDLTFDDVSYYGHESKRSGSIEIKSKDSVIDGVLQQINAAKSLEQASATFRLKTLMDMWCALWFWPIDKVDELPSYDDFLAAAEILGTLGLESEGQMVFDFFGDVKMTVEKDNLVKQFKSAPSFDNLYRLFPFIRTVREIAARQRFLHWELAFINVFAQRGGFDFVIGNPPWVNVDWNEAGLLSEYDPRIAVRKVSASDVTRLRDGVFANYGEARKSYLTEFADTVGARAFFSSEGNYAALSGTRTNLYKYFIPLAFRVVGDEGVTGYLHPEGIYDDPKGGKLRSEAYPRLRFHAQFINELRLFDIDHHVHYGLNVYGPAQAAVGFRTISKLYHPSTLDESLAAQDVTTELPLERNAKGTWNTVGHPDRVVPVTDDTLSVFVKLYDDAGTPRREARLPALYTRQFLKPILDKFAHAQKKMGECLYGVSDCWNETTAQKDGTIKRKTGFAPSADEVIYSGPLFFVGNPINKTARPNCRLNSDFDNVDLTVMPEAYRPRTNYVRNVDKAEYAKRMPEYEGRKISDYHCIICRNFVSPTSERTLIPIFSPKGVAHVNSLIEWIFNERIDMSELTSIFGSWMSLPFDWFVRSTGRNHIFDETTRLLPCIGKHLDVSSRALLLNCLNRDYAELWSDAWDDAYANDGWLSSDPCLTKWSDHFATGKEWTWATPLRTQLDRRQALVELDVIVTKALGLSLDDLLLMYRVSFPTLRKYDADTYYDQNGRCVFSAKSGESYLSRKEWESIRDMKEGETFEKTITERVFSDDPTTRTIVYKAPFFKKCREDDYREAWEMLEKRD